MSSAEQALLMTAILFGLSFAAIFLFWFAEKFISEGRNFGVSSRLAE
jgi:multisubunit Na+/H+ antiporter MnhC subunit